MTDTIFEKWCDNECPVCNGVVGSGEYIGETINSGKIMAQYFVCHHCASEYTVGFNRNRQPINSEITLNTNI